MRGDEPVLNLSKFVEILDDFVDFKNSETALSSGGSNSCSETTIGTNGWLRIVGFQIGKPKCCHSLFICGGSGPSNILR